MKLASLPTLMCRSISQTRALASTLKLTRGYEEPAFDSAVATNTSSTQVSQSVPRATWNCAPSVANAWFNSANRRSPGMATSLVPSAVARAGAAEADVKVTPCAPFAPGAALAVMTVTPGKVFGDDSDASKTPSTN